MTTDLARATSAGPLPGLTPADIARAGAEAVAGKSDKTRAAYRERLEYFAVWYVDEWHAGVWDKRLLHAFRDHLITAGKSSSTINGYLAAIRSMLREAADLGLIDAHVSDRLCRVQGVAERGVRTGNWLSKPEAQTLVELPDGKTLKGKRDRAILTLLVTCGLRRDELARLTVGHLQQREGHWVIVDLVGKGNRVRSVKLPGGVKRIIDEWLAASGRDAAGSDAPLFGPVGKGGHHQDPHARMSAKAVYDVVVQYSALMGKDSIRPHDLRRTMAKLARAGGAGLEQIQMTLGHADLDTTQVYLGATLDLDDSAPDHVGLALGGGRQERAGEVAPKAAPGV